MWGFRLSILGRPKVGYSKLAASPLSIGARVRIHSLGLGVRVWGIYGLGLGRTLLRYGRHGSVSGLERLGFRLPGLV